CHQNMLSCVGVVHLEATRVNRIDRDASLFDEVVGSLRISRIGIGAGIEIGIDAAAKPYDIFVAGKLSELDAYLLEKAFIVDAKRIAAERRKMRHDLLRGSKEKLVIGGEVLNENGCLSDAGVEGEGKVSRKSFKEAIELAGQVHLIGDAES